MQIELTDNEREFLAALLESTYQDKFKELHHTDDSQYRDFVRSEIEMLETLKAKLTQA